VMVDLHIVIVGRFAAAISDWRDSLSQFNPNIMQGIDGLGRTVRFVSIDNPDALRGLKFETYEFHDSAFFCERNGAIHEFREICEERLRRNTIRGEA